jgi:hypothetical protein
VDLLLEWVAGAFLEIAWTKKNGIAKVICPSQEILILIKVGSSCPNLSHL